MEKLKSLHTVTLDGNRCKGCVTCMKRCPTQAIRVRNGKASVIYDKCIGCGECVRLCPHHAKIASYDKFEVINNFKYKIALPAPSLYGQFNNLKDVNYVLTGLKRLGFDEVFEVGRGAELCSHATQVLLNKETIKKPVISTACPAVLELIYAKYENLKDNLLKLLAPVDVAAKLARESAIERGIPKEDIGVFFISPCPAKVFALKAGIGVEKPLVDGVLAISEVYMKLLPEMKKIEEPEKLSKMGVLGLNWAASSGEAIGAGRAKYLAADGIENVIAILNSIEDGSLSDVDFIELNACISGCVGGVLNVENPFVARARLRGLRSKFPQTANTLADVGKSFDYYKWEKEPDFTTKGKKVEDRQQVFNKLMEIQKLYSTLPQSDCGLCGAPSCRAFCEDIVNGKIPKDSKCLMLDR
ncbi:MAG: 4Fe-4S dicluster domain-containing protein [Clostridiales bacterium]|nr:4Fe-4S dicluster domain-containing protein [Clostridiales bacterium]